MEENKELDEETKRMIKERDEKIARAIKETEEAKPKPGTWLYIYEQNKAAIRKLRRERRQYIMGKGF